MFVRVQINVSNIMPSYCDLLVLGQSDLSAAVSVCIS